MKKTNFKNNSGSVIISNPSLLIILLAIISIVYIMSITVYTPNCPSGTEWNGAVCVSSTMPTPQPTPAPITTPIPTPAATTTPSNILSNGVFNVISPWVGYGAGTTVITTNGYAKATVGTEQVYSQMRYTPLLTIQPGTYKLSFRAYSSDGSDMYARLYSQSAYTYYGLNQQVPLTTSWQLYSYTFTNPATVTNTDGKFIFLFAGLGSQGDVYYVDDVVLQKV